MNLESSKKKKKKKNPNLTTATLRIKQEETCIVIVVTSPSDKMETKHLYMEKYSQHVNLLTTFTHLYYTKSLL